MGFIAYFGGKRLILVNSTWYGGIACILRGIQDSPFSREITRNPLNRTPGWTSRKAAEVLRLIRVWGGYLRPGVEFSQISPF